jgi:cobalt-zinc-cadmium efflux system protein
VDPLCTFIFAVSVMWVTKTLIVDVTRDLMEAAPADVDVRELLEAIKGVELVVGVHDLHVWRIGTGKVILTAHIDVESCAEPYRVVQEVEDVIGAHGIAHSTVQICGADETLAADGTCDAALHPAACPPATRGSQ